MKFNFVGNANNTMTGNFSARLLLLLLPAFTFFTSCNGQVKTDVPVNSISEINEGELPKMIKDQGTYSYMTHTGPHSDTNTSISCILEDKDGNIWVATMGEGVYCYNGTSFTHLTAKDGLMTNVVYSIIEDRAGNLWFGTTNGACRYDGKTFAGYPFSVIKRNAPAIGSQANASDPQAEVPSMLQDKDGKIWLGTTNGVYCYDGTAFKNILTMGTLTSELQAGHSDFFAVPAIIQDKEGDIWFTSWSEGLCRFDGTAITIFKSQGHLLSNKGLLQDKNGDIWIAERGYGGVSLYDGKTFKRLFTHLLITDIKADDKGNVWLATFDRKHNSGSIVCYDPSTNETISQFNVQEKTGRNTVSCMAIDRSGNIWFGSNKMTLSRYDGKVFTTFVSDN